MPISTFFFFFSSAPSYWGKLLNLISKTTPQQSEKRERDDVTARRRWAIIPQWAIWKSFLQLAHTQRFVDITKGTHAKLKRIIAIKHSTLIGDLTSHSQSAFFFLLCEFVNSPFMSTASESDLSGSGDDSILTPCHVARSTRSTSLRWRCD